MDDLIRSFTEYLHHTLGITVKAEKWDGYRSLPVFMQSLYDCYAVRILGEQCILLVSRAEEEATPAVLRRHYDIIRKKWTGSVILVRRAIRSNDRQRLVVDYKLPFVVPGNQLYLPDIGLDMREHFRRIRKQEELFSPSTQALVLRVLLTRSYEPLVSTQLADVVPYTPMTIKRSLDEVRQAQIAVTCRRGREREIRFRIAGRELWDAALPFLRTPIQRQVTARFPPGEMACLEAGLTALSRYSMISAPASSTLAVSSKAWKAAKANPHVRETACQDEDAHQLEIWRYDPTLLSAENTVDRLSLFLSLRDSNDERIEAALEEMMESVRW